MRWCIEQKEMEEVSEITIGWREWCDGEGVDDGVALSLMYVNWWFVWEKTKM